MHIPLLKPCAVRWTVTNPITCPPSLSAPLRSLSAPRLAAEPAAEERTVNHQAAGSAARAGGLARASFHDVRHALPLPAHPAQVRVAGGSECGSEPMMEVWTRVNVRAADSI